MYEGITFDDFLKVGVWEKRGWCGGAALRGLQGQPVGQEETDQHLRRERSGLDVAFNTISRWFHLFLLKKYSHMVETV